MVGNRFSYNGYSYTRAPTLDWGNVDRRRAADVTFSKVNNEHARGRRRSR